MEIRKTAIETLKKGGFRDVRNEGLCDVKVLRYLSVVQSVKGSYEIALGAEKPLHTGEGGFFIAPAGARQTIVHHVDPISGTMTCRWIFLEVTVNDAYPLDSLYRFPTVITDRRKTLLNALFDRLFATDDPWENRADCYRLCGLLVQEAQPLQTDKHPTVAQSAHSYIAAHYRAPITVRELARAANTSPSHFHAAFKKQTGISPIAYLNHYRLSLAAERLSDTEEPVKQICARVGIRDPLYFGKLFKKTYGITPKAYRLTYRKTIQPNS